MMALARFGGFVIPASSRSGDPVSYCRISHPSSGHAFSTFRRSRVCVRGLSFAQSVKEDVNKATQGTADAAHKTGDAVKEGTKKTVDKTKEAADKTKDAVVK